MEAKIFDTHVHYDDACFDEDREELVSALPSCGVGGFVNISSDWDSIAKTLSIAEKHQGAYAALGLHPSELEGVDKKRLTEIEELFVSHKKAVAVGEIGLDYHYDDGPSRDLQRDFFCLQMDMAKRLSKPIVVHSRDAAKDTYDLMASMHAEEIGGVVHCFSYSADMAGHFVDMGFFIGIGGVSTFRNAKKIQEVIYSVPLENIVLETDAPYLAPEPFRGKRNSSAYLPYVAERIASIKGCGVEKVYAKTWENAHRLYRL